MQTLKKVLTTGPVFYSRTDGYPTDNPILFLTLTSVCSLVAAFMTSDGSHPVYEAWLGWWFMTGAIFVVIGFFQKSIDTHGRTPPITIPKTAGQGSTRGGGVA